MPKNPLNCLKVIGRGWSNIALTLESILQINDWNRSGSSRQPHYCSRSGRKQIRGFKEQKLPWCPKENRLIGPPVINTRGSSGVNRLGACVGTPGHLWSLLSWESDPWDLNLWGQSILQCGPLQTGHGAGGNSAWDALPSHRYNKLIPFHLGPSGRFSQAISEQV